MTKRTIFVTVGTTRFDKLIEGVTRPATLEWMKTNGYTDLIIQYGNGNAPMIPSDTPVSIQAYGFQSSLDHDMKAADLIIGHAGAGTVMEALRLQKRMVVVINTLLMDNHQVELASAMAKRGHLSVVEEPGDLVLMDTWNDFDAFVPIPHEGGNAGAFCALLNSHMGIGA
jgi:beta-1,4-N-acetylglucosaminyltransferase